MLLVVVLLCCCFVTAVPQSEIDAVHAMAKVWTGTWSQTNNNVCSFIGVDCEVEDGELHIVSIRLDNTVLQSVPDAISGLTYLRYLRLGFCQLSSVSSVVFQMPRLDLLDLTGNEISSLSMPQVPSTISPSLRTIILNDNRLTALPETIFLMPALESLDASINNIDSLQMRETTTTTSLRLLILPHNNLTSLPESISKLSGLEILDFSENQIQQLPDGVFDLHMIKRLNGSYNKLTSGLTRCLTSFSNLQYLDARHNQIDEPFPQTVDDFPQLVSLLLTSNRISGTLPTVIAAPKLENMSLGNNRLSGRLPEFAESPLLRDIEYENNDFEGTIPRSYANLQSLETLEMSNNPRLTGYIPVELGALSLFRLTVRNTSLYGVFPSCLRFSGTGSVGCFIDVEDFECGVSSICGINKPCPADKQDLCVCNSNMTECGCGSPDFHCEGSSGCVGVGLCSPLIGESSFSDNSGSDSNDSNTLVIILIGVFAMTAILIIIASVVILRRRFAVSYVFKSESVNGQIHATADTQQALLTVDSSPSKQSLARFVSGYDKIYAPLANTTKIHHEINPEEIWTTGHKLGEGNFGAVWQGEYNGKDVAIKEVLQNRVDEKELDEFMKEANLMMAMGKHENVVEFIGIVREPLFIVVEFMHLGDLKSRLDKRDAELRTRKIDVLFDVSKGMAFLASKGIVHRDLAARNVLLDKNYRATVADFGLARLLSREGSAYTTSDVGPVRWMSPEAIVRRKGSEKSDVWMFGILCYEVFSDGALPFMGFNLVQVCSMIPQGKYPDFPSTAPTLFANKFIGSRKGQLFALEDKRRPTFQQLVDFFAANIDSLQTSPSTVGHYEQAPNFNANTFAGEVYHSNFRKQLSEVVSGYDKIYAPLANTTKIHHEINPEEIWTTGHKLGEGNFGAVWQGEYNGKDVAIKEVLQNRVDEKELDEFMKEANLMMAMGKHENVVEFIGIVREPLFIVVEFMHLGDLKSLLNKRDAELRTRKIDVLFDVSKGMAFLASKGIVHRDLAARNVLLDKNYRATVADFGLARLLSREGSAYTTSDVGPVRWMSPEAIVRRKGSEKSDVWMFGILCYEVFSDGALPFMGFNLMQVCSMITQGKYPDFPSTVPSLFANKFVGSRKGQLFALEDKRRPTFQQLVDFFTANIHAMLQNIYALAQSSVSNPTNTPVTIHNYDFTPHVVSTDGPHGNKSMDGSHNYEVLQKHQLLG